MAYRSAVHESTCCTPAKMMFGRDLRLPVDLLLGRPVEETLVSAKEYTTDLCEKLERVHCFARNHLKLSSDRMKQRYDLLVQEEQPLEAGDAVWLHNPQRKKGLSPKLQRPWQGPYLVVKRINDLVYRIQLGPKCKPKVVHRNRLWKYTGSNTPTWLNTSGDVEKTAPPQNGHTATSSEALSSQREQSQVMSKHQQQPRRSAQQRRAPDRYGVV